MRDALGSDASEGFSANSPPHLNLKSSSLSLPVFSSSSQLKHRFNMFQYGSIDSKPQSQTSKEKDVRQCQCLAVDLHDVHMFLDILRKTQLSSC